MPTPIESRSLQTVDRGRQLVAAVSHRLTGREAIAVRSRNGSRAEFGDRQSGDGPNGPCEVPSITGWLVATVAAAYVVDCVLAASVVDDLGARLFGDSGMLRALFRFVFPATLVIFEGGCGQRAAEGPRHYLWPPKRESPWAPGDWASDRPGDAVPCGGDSDRAVPWRRRTGAAFNLMTAALTFAFGAASLALHLFLLFNGPETMEAKGYVLARLRHRRRLVGRERKAQHQVRNLLEERLEDTYARYDQALRDHNAQHLHLRRDPGPFAARTIRLVNEMLQRHEGDAGPAAAPGGGPVPPRPVPPSPPPAQHGEDEITLCQYQRLLGNPFLRRDKCFSRKKSWRFLMSEIVFPSSRTLDFRDEPRFHRGERGGAVQGQLAQP